MTRFGWIPKRRNTPAAKCHVSCVGGAQINSSFSSMRGEMYCSVPFSLGGKSTPCKASAFRSITSITSS